MNHTFWERIRCMILNEVLPKKFWGEALSTTCYLMNWCSSSVIGFKTPMELWSGTSSDYSSLRVFNCLEYAHSRQDKLEARILRCIFIGYPEGVKWYKVWNVESKWPRCFNTRAVVFDESKMAYGEGRRFSSYNSGNTDSQVEVKLLGKIHQRNQKYILINAPART